MDAAMRAEIFALKLDEVATVVFDELSDTLGWIGLNASEDFTNPELQITPMEYLTNHLTSKSLELKMRYGEVTWEYVFLAMRSATKEVMTYSFVANARNDTGVIYNDVHYLTLNQAKQFNVLSVPFFKSGFADHFVQRHNPDS